VRICSANSLERKGLALIRRVLVKAEDEVVL
jgi:hypothetical protein